MRPEIVTVDARLPDPPIITAAAAILESHGVVIFPTRCLYGLAVDAFHPEAIHNLFRIKKRSPDNPILVLIPHPSFLEKMVQDIPETAIKIMEQFWPGQVTIVFHARRNVIPGLTAGSGKIGIRLPDHPVAAALVKKMGSPITGTSANLSNRGGCAVVKDIDPTLTAQVDLILDAGRLAGGVGSTVIDVTAYPPIMLREGVIPAQKIFNSI